MKTKAPRRPKPAGACGDGVTVFHSGEGDETLLLDAGLRLGKVATAVRSVQLVATVGPDDESIEVFFLLDGEDEVREPEPLPDSYHEQLHETLRARKG